jgi:hypothetical protein
MIFINYIKRKAVASRWIAFITCMIIASASLNAQEDTTVSEEAEEPELISPALDFITIQKGDKSIDLKASLGAKVDGNFYKLPHLKITFFAVTDSSEKELGYVITDREGVAKYNYKDKDILTDASGKLTVKAYFAGNKSMESAEGEATIKRAFIEMTPMKGDSLLTMDVKLVDLVNASDSNIAEVPLSLYVKRMFNPLKVGEGTSDESGFASIEVPQDLPGDPKGNLNFIARLDESEVYGIVEAERVEQWGIPVSNMKQDQPRSLWSSSPPLWMLITFIILMAAVWGHYIVIVYQLFRLRKEEPTIEKTN